jgi:hypothetical protein
MRIKQAGVVAAAAATAAGVLGLASTAQASVTTGWRSAYSKHFGASKSYSGYQSMVAFSATNAWAFGAADESRVTSEQLVALHWNGKVWSSVALPAKATGDVTGVSAPAANSIWLVTLNGQAAHWNGAQWTVTELPRWAGGELTGVTAVSPTNVWVFGAGGMNGGVGTWHFNGKTWTEWKSGGAAGLDSGSAVSPSSIWALGGNGLSNTAIEHFNGKAWQTVSAKALKGLQFSGIRAFSDHDVWVEADGALLHYNGKTWSRIAAPRGEQFGAVTSVDPRGGLWIEGGTTTKTYILHRTATGSTWTAIPAPAASGVDALAPIPGDSGLWAAGDQTTGSVGATAKIWAYGKV